MLSTILFRNRTVRGKRNGPAFLIVAMLTLVCFPSTAWSSWITLYQTNFLVEGTPISNSDWGQVELSFTGQDPMLYFNLAVNGSWQVQNLPVLSREGTGVPQSAFFAFDLGVLTGTDVTSATAAFTLSAAVQAMMPGSPVPTAVGNILSVATRAVGEQAPVINPAAPLVGGEVAGMKRSHSNFPNQEAEDKQCAPVAASNSLKWLKEKYNLSVSDSEISIAKMDEIMADHPEGGKFRDTWWVDKNDFLVSKGIPIVTEKITSLRGIISEFDQGKDVELQGDWHTAAIVGITELMNGRFSIDVAHDTQQGMNGGTRVDTIVFNSTTGKFEGSPGFFDGSTFQYAVSESVVPEPSTFVLMGLGSIGLIAHRWRLRKTAT